MHPLGPPDYLSHRGRWLEESQDPQKHKVQSKALLLRSKVSPVPGKDRSPQKAEGQAEEKPR